MSDRGRGPPGERLSFGKGAAKAVDDYWEYTRLEHCQAKRFAKYFLFSKQKVLPLRIVGNDDGGVPFTPEQYENYKREVLPMVCGRI